MHDVHRSCTEMAAVLHSTSNVTTTYVMPCNNHICSTISTPHRWIFKLCYVKLVTLQESYVTKIHCLLGIREQHHIKVITQSVRQSPTSATARCLAQSWPSTALCVLIFVWQGNWTERLVSRNIIIKNIAHLCPLSSRYRRSTDRGDMKRAREV